MPAPLVPPRRHPVSRPVVVAVTVTIVAATALGLLFLLPIPRSATERIAFSILLPYNVSENRCDWLTFSHGGSFSFAISIPNGNAILLTVTSPTNATAYRGIGYSSIDGTFGANSVGAYEFCLGTMINYPYEGGFATLAGTLTYSMSSPIL